MKIMSGLSHVLPWLICAVLIAEPEDWRLQLLKEEKFDLEGVELSVRENQFIVSEERFLQLVQELASDDFKTRESAQKEILRMGIMVKPWLDNLPKPKDPELAFRLTTIRSNLGSERQWANSELLRYATADLDRENKGKKPDLEQPLVFAELFRDNTANLDDEYRNFVFIRDQRLKGKVSGGVLRLSGEMAREGDQRLVLKSEKVYGQEVFPDEFRIEVSLKGTPGGEGTYHLGVSVGNVRTLFHTGYRGGGFRFARIDTLGNLSNNADMGFTPNTNTFATLCIDVKQLPNKNVELSATVRQKGEKRPFQSKIEISAEVIGKLDSISLDRSGNPGGDAIFDNLVVEMKRN